MITTLFKVFSTSGVEVCVEVCFGLILILIVSTRFLLLVVRPLLLVVRPGAPSSVLAPTPPRTQGTLWVMGGTHERTQKEDSWYLHIRKTWKFRGHRMK